MTVRFRQPARATRALLLAFALLPLAGQARAQGGPGTPAASGSPSDDGPLVEVAPIRCWWRTSAGAVALGELFELRLTCAVIDTPAVQVVPDESRLTVAGVQLTPFEVVGGEHPADTHAGQRRFFQYRYTLRLLDANEIGQDVSLPRLPISYKVQSRVAADSTLAGRDFTYMMPGLSVRVLSQVPNDAFDIRDGADVGLERIEDLQFRARLLDITSIALGAGAALLGILALVAFVARARRTEPRGPSRVSDRRVLAAAASELARVAREGRIAWTPELVSAGHAALRIVSAIALGRSVSEQPLAPGTAAADGRLPVRSPIPGRPGAAVTSASTVADLVRALAALPADTPGPDRAGLENLHAALTTLTAAQYASGDPAPDPVALGAALDAGQSEATRLARQRRWDWLRPASILPARRHGVARS